MRNTGLAWQDTPLQGQDRPQSRQGAAWPGNAHVVKPLGASITIPGAACVTRLRAMVDARLDQRRHAPGSGPVPGIVTATRSAAGSGKTALTLRLDADRHLRLRLASVSQGRSAQALMIAALDHFLANAQDGPNAPDGPDPADDAVHDLF